MNAPEHELLVHISAPSSVKDDRRYMSLAQSILEFQPAFATKVSGADWIYSVFTAADEHHDPTRDRLVSVAHAIEDHDEAGQFTFVLLKTTYGRAYDRIGERSTTPRINLVQGLLPKHGP